MTPQPTALALAIATALGALVASPANALVVTTSTVGFSVSGNVTDAEAADSTSTTITVSPTLAVGEFDSSLGVLTGTTLNLTSNQTETVTVTAVGTGKSNTNLTTSGSGSSTANITAAGVNTTFTTISESKSCTGIDQNGCTGKSSDSKNATSGSFVVNSANLDSYVGGGTESVSLSTTLSATQGAGTFTGAESTKYSLTWASAKDGGKDGGVSATYEYLLHAAPSFDDDVNSPLLTLNLDFGTLYLDQDAAAQNFSIFNLLATDRVGLDLDSFSGAGDTAQFTTDLATFLGLAAGSDNDYYFDFITSALGDFSASYSFVFSDANVGASSSRFTYNGLVINLTGRVIERTVPAPGVLALLGSGLVALGLGRRRRR